MYSGISFERFPAVDTTPRQLARSYVFCITSHKSPVTTHELSPFPASLTRHLFLSPLLPTLTECPSVSPLLPTLTKYQGVAGPPLLTSPRPKMGIAPETWTASKSTDKTLGPSSTVVPNGVRAVRDSSSIVASCREAPGPPPRVRVQHCWTPCPHVHPARPPSNSVIGWGFCGNGD
jgi:hypothetical protein